MRQDNYNLWGLVSVYNFSICSNIRLVIWKICRTVSRIRWHSVLFVGPLIPLFWTSVDVSFGFQSQSGQPYLHFGRGICVTFSLRFNSGATPADLLVDSMATKPFSSTYLWAGIGGAQTQDLSCCCSKCEIRQKPYRLSYDGLATFGQTWT